MLGLRPFMKTFLMALLAIAAGRGLEAQIMSEAMLAFPAQTDSLEYDNLASLRTLPNYEALRQRFSGKPLEQVKTALGLLDIPESQVREIVIGSSPTAFYGLLSGTFNGTAAAKAAAKKGTMPVMSDGVALYCTADAACVTFLEDSLAAFGTSGQLKMMLAARQGAVPRLSSKTNLVYLIGRMDQHAPVRGVASGSQLQSALTDALQGQSGLNVDWSQIASSINAFEYSVTLDSKAHVSSTLECKSQTTAAVLRQMLGAVGSLQSVASKAGKDEASMPFQNLQVSSSGAILNVKMDTPMPAA